MKADRYQPLRDAIAAAPTAGPWTAFDMVHGERGDAMTPEEIGEYVKNSVIKSAKNGGSLDRFLFIRAGEGDEARDVCHVGNGAAGPANALLMAAADPDTIAALLADYDREKSRADSLADQVSRDFAKIAELIAERNALLAVRNDTLETAALICDAREHRAVTRPAQACYRMMAKDIRALKGAALATGDDA